MNLAGLLTQHARDHPDAPALHDRRRGQDRTTTYRALDDAARSVSTTMAEHGLATGDRVLVLQPMSLELYATILGTLRAGAIVVVPDLSMDRRSLNKALAEFPCKAFIGTRRAHLLRLLMGNVRRIPTKFVTNGWLPFTNAWPTQTPNRAEDLVDVPNGHPAVLTFTSGSTGRPKAALRTHGFLLAQEKAISALVDSGLGDTDLAFLPMFVLANLARGVASVLPDADLRRPATIDASRVLEQARRYNVTSVGGPPTVLSALAKAATTSGKGLDALRWIHTGGGPVFPFHIDLLAHLGRKAEVVAVYGSTEAEPIAEASSRELTQHDRDETARGGGLLAGRPVPSIRLAILKNEWGRPIGPFDARGFRDAQAKAGQAGEIVVSGDHVLQGYVDPRDDRETKFKVGIEPWHRTGDGGRIDPRGRLWLLGRCAARIEDDHGELWPLGVEAAARGDPRVDNAALVAGRKGRLLAVVGAIAPEELRKRLSWARLDEVRIVKRLPMDRRHQSKVDYTRLRKQLAVR